MLGVNRTKLFQALTSLGLMLGIIGAYWAFLSPPLSPYPVEMLVQDGAKDAPPGPAALEAVRSEPETQWHPVDTRSLGLWSNTSRTIWLRVRLPAISQAKRLVADINAPFLREVDFYLVRNGQLQETSAQGMDRPFATRPYHFFTQAFGFQVDGSEGSALYVRVKSELIVSLPLALIDEVPYVLGQSTRIAILAGFFGMYCGLFLYNLFVFANLPDLTNFYSNFYQLGIFVVGFVANGEGFLIAPYFAEHFTLTMRIIALFLCVTSIGMALFLRAVAGLKTTDPIANVAVLTYIGLSTVIGLPFMLLAPAFMVLPVVLTSLIGGGALISVGSLIRGHSRNEFYFHLAMVGLGVAELLYLGANLGLVPRSTLTDSMFHWGAIWHAVCLSGVITNRIRDMQAERRLIVETLKNQQPASQLNGLLKTNYVATRQEVTVSIMFIDIVGFSKLGKFITAKEVLELLKGLMQEMTSVVSEHGGIVDRSLGDGILCFFGYTNRASLRSHAQDAFAAAREIQRRLVAAAQAAPEATIILPVRIGIHVDQVLIGDLGGKDRVDFTMIGDGVNFASRLETACSPFKIMVSGACRERLPRVAAEDLAFSEILVAMKHSDELVAAFEYNPFYGAEDLLKQVEKRYLRQLNIAAKDQRFPILAAAGISLSTSIGSFKVLDFSAYGFRTLSEVYVGQKVTLLVRLSTSNEAVDSRLKELLLDSFHVEVRWSRRTSAGFEHGFKIYGFTPEQSLNLFLALRHLLATDADRPESFKLA